MRRKTRSPARGEPSASPAALALSGYGTATNDDATDDVDQHDVIDECDAEQAGAKSAGITPKRPPARSAEEPTVAAAAGDFLATGSSADAARQPGEKNGGALNIAPTPPHTSPSPERAAGDVAEAAACNPQTPHAASATPDADEVRKRRRIERFTPPTTSEIAMSAAAATAARIAAGRAHDWSAQSPPAGDVAGSTRTRQARRQQAGAKSAEGTPKRPPARSAEEPTVAAAAGVFLATGSHGDAARQPGEKNGGALNIAPTPPHTSPSPERAAGDVAEAAARNPQAPHAASATPDADEVRKRRRIERFITLQDL